MGPESARSHAKIEGVYWASLEGDKRPATLNLVPGNTTYGEMTFQAQGKEYRIWDPYRSKLAAAILKGLTQMPIRPGSKVLYLGAASGTTVSHVSDIVATKGQVYCVEFAQRSFRDLVGNICSVRRNTTPIFGDARFPAKYRDLVSTVDCVYCDIAQPDQARIIADNMDMFLDPAGGFLLAVKSRSIDVTKSPSEIFRQEARILEERNYRCLEMLRLDPFEGDHCMISGRR